jgi:hypothetical protein
LSNKIRELILSIDDRIEIKNIFVEDDQVSPDEFLHLKAIKGDCKIYNLLHIP